MSEFVNIKVKYKAVVVEEFTATVRVKKENAYQCTGECPYLSDDIIDQLATEQRHGGKQITLHHSHYKKLRKSGRVGWFDFKFGKPKAIKAPN